MRTKTVDQVVRESLMSKALPIHYYLSYLHFALKCLEELYMDFDFGNVREEKLTISNINRIDIPLLATDIISVFGLYEEKELPFVRNTNITSVINVENSVNAPYKKGVSNLGENYNSFSSLTKQTAPGELPTSFNLKRNLKYEYNIDFENNQIVLGIGHELTNIYVKYLVDNNLKTTANVVHYYAIPVVESFIEYRSANSSGYPQSAIAVLRDNYYNEKRLLKGRMSTLGKAEILNILLN